MDGLVLGMETPVEDAGGLLGDLGGGDPVEPVEGEELAEGAEPAEGEEPAEPAADAAAQAAARADRTRSEVVKFLREGRNDPERKPMIDALSKAWYRDQEYAALGDVKDLRSLKEQVDILGGPEAVGRLRDLETSVESIDSMVDAGDPQVIKDMFAESPEGMKKLVPAALDQLRTLDAQAYAAALTPHLAQAVEASGLGDFVTSARELIDQAYQAKDPEHARFYMEKAFQQVTAVAGWLKNLSKLPKNGAEPRDTGAPAAPSGREGGRAPVPAPASPELTAQVQGQLVPWAKTEIEKALKPLLGATKLDAAKMNDMVSLTAAEIDRRLSADPEFSKNLQAWQRTGKLERIVKQAQAGIGSVVAASARAVWDRHGTKPAAGAVRPPTGGAVKPAAGAAKPAAGKPAILVSRKPADGEFAPGQNMMDVIIRQQGVRKDGVLVRWK